MWTLNKNMWVRKKTQYGGDVVMFLRNKIVKNKKIELSVKKCCNCTWFENHVQGLLNNPLFYCTWFRRALQMVLKPCASNPWFQEGLAHDFKTMYDGDVVMFVPNKIKILKNIICRP